MRDSREKMFEPNLLYIWTSIWVLRIQNAGQNLNF